MNLSQQINEDMKAAMRGGDRLRLETLRTLRAAILEFEKEKAGNALDDESALRILTAAAKRRKEAIEQYRAGGREDLATQEEKELEIITSYLPAQLTEEEVAAEIRAAIEEAGATEMKDFGRVMGPLMKKLQGRADGATIQTMLRAALGGR